MAKTEAVKTVTRSLVLPVAGPQDATWAELRVALRQAWAESTRCANWMLTELYLRDTKRTPDMEKLPRMPKVYLYPEARHLFPALASQSVASLEREVTRKYRARRYQVLWTQSASLPVMRYPVGLPLPSQMWRLSKQDGRWLLSCRIGGQRWQLRLRGGPHFYHQLAILEEVLAGRILAGAATLYRTISRPSDHRSEALPQSRLLVRLPVKMPVVEDRVRVRAGTLQVKTTGDALLVAEDKERIWVEHCHHMRRAILARERQQLHLSEDLKAERRRPNRARAGIVKRMGERSRRHQQALRTWIHEAAAHLIGYAQRRHFEAVEYNDSDHSFLHTFPWHELRQRIQEKCETVDIRFALAVPNRNGTG